MPFVFFHGLLLRHFSCLSAYVSVCSVRTLVEEMKDAVDVDKQQEMGDRLNKGIFTLRDMYEQFQVSLCVRLYVCSTLIAFFLQSVMKLGPLNKVMGMIPGIPPWMAQGAGAADGDNRIKGTRGEGMEEVCGNPTHYDIACVCFGNCGDAGRVAPHDPITSSLLCCLL